MKCVKNILSILLTMILSVVAISSFAATETSIKGEGSFVIEASTRSIIEGDCKLYLPGSDAVELTYNLLDPDGNDITENVVYSISSDDVESNKWVEIDSKTGVVHVKGDAFGKSFMVSATSSTYSASQIVEISETALSFEIEDGATSRFRAKNSEGQGYSNILDNAKIATLEGKFMFESESMARLGHGTGTLLYQYGSGVNFDIRYGFITKELAFITLNMADGNGDASAKDIMYVPADEWIDIRVEFDNSDDNFDFFINDIKVVENEKHSVPSLYSFFEIGCAFDDLSFYNGVKDVKAGDFKSFFKTYKDDEELSENTIEFVWDTATPEGGSSKVVAAILTDEDLAGKSAIAAIYNSNGELVGLDLAEATENAARINLVKVKIQTSVSEGSRAKIFLWDMETLCPLNNKYF